MPNYQKTSICEIKSSSKKTTTNKQEFYVTLFFSYKEGIATLVGVSVELQIVGSESISEATKYAKYVSEFGNEKDSDDEEDLINSRDVFQSFDI